MTGLLASVSTLDEALRLLEFDVDIIDLKQPAHGALGALSVGEVALIVNAIGRQRPVSATIGDLPMQAELIVPAVTDMASTGVDYIKIGFFPGGDWAATIDALSPLAQAGLSIVAVLFADTRPDLAWIGALKRAGFCGVMLDTMNKSGGSLLHLMSLDTIAAFVSRATEYRMLCGLAGSLRAADVPLLLRCGPDYLGFRGALCRQGDRTAQLDDEAIQAIVRHFCRHKAELQTL